MLFWAHLRAFSTFEAVWERQSEPGSNVVDAHVEAARQDWMGWGKITVQRVGVGFMIGSKQRMHCMAWEIPRTNDLPPNRAEDVGARFMES